MEAAIAAVSRANLVQAPWQTNALQMIRQKQRLKTPPIPKNEQQALNQPFLQPSDTIEAWKVGISLTTAVGDLNFSVQAVHVHDRPAFGVRVNT